MKGLSKSIGSIVEKAFLLLSSIASILGLIFLWVNDPMKANIALGFFCVSLFIILFTIIKTLNSNLACSSPNGYVTDSSYIRYFTRDGSNIEYETYKYIQCKKLLLTEHEHGFRWSGTQEPEIFSDIQKVQKIQKTSNDTYDKITLKFKNPLRYNECETIHLKMKLDDSDGKSEKYLETRLMSPLKLLRWKIELLHKNEGYNGRATLKKKKISDDFNHQYCDVKTISFDTITKSYDLSLPWPEPGYYYRLEWIP